MNINKDLNSLFEKLMFNELSSIRLIDNFLLKWEKEINPEIWGTLVFNKAFILEKNNLLQEACEIYNSLLTKSIAKSTETNVLLGLIRYYEQTDPSKVPTFKRKLDALKTSNN